ncbi:MAG: hypothetical protein AUG16_03320 [Thaumarchaeota archaeon 13_1_20CM_2_39_20]|nr:MAG: hypothetical protein AUG16_03320 [Thaumarchaeota archaeon 13_1_20CM_2_39_20]
MLFSWNAFPFAVLITVSVVIIYSSYGDPNTANQANAETLTKMTCSDSTLNAQLGGGLAGDTIILDNNTLAKYPDLQEVLDGVKQHPYQPSHMPDEEGRFVAPIEIAPMYQKTISGNVTAAMLGDPKLGFTHPYSCGDKSCNNYAHLKLGDTDYLVYIFHAKCSSKKYYSPREQIANGILSKDVICYDSLHLIFRSIDDSPVCVKPQTAQKLIERGWAIMIIDKIGTTSRAAKCVSVNEPLYPFPTLIHLDDFVRNMRDVYEVTINETAGYVMLHNPNGWIGSSASSTYGTRIIPCSIPQGSMKVSNSNFTINYGIIEGQLHEITFYHDKQMLALSFWGTGEGSITVKIPRNLLDARIPMNVTNLQIMNGTKLDSKNSYEGKFLVTTDRNLESDYQEEKTSSYRTLTIPFHYDTKGIYIIGYQPS